MLIQSLVSTRGRKLHPGFTLIELLVVITIVAILAGILMPAIGMVKASGKQRVCANGLRQFAMAMLQYANEHDGLTPTTFMVKGQENGLIDAYFDSAVVNAGGGANTTSSFLADAATFGKCPEVRAYYLAQGRAMMGLSGNSAAYAPLYGISTYVPLNSSATIATNYGNNLNLLSLIAKSAQTGFMFCGDAQWQTATGVDGGLRRYPQFPHRSQLGFVVQATGSSSLQKPAALDGTCNVSYFDGHVAPLLFQDPTGGLTDFDADKYLVVSTNNPATSAPSDVTGNAKTKWMTFWKGN
jgi:prepilin-type N-terminal cleavage/methylation domain-containing protein/prepilin-type processing-associated H-X9-DG protein